MKKRDELVNFIKLVNETLDSNLNEKEIKFYVELILDYTVEWTNVNFKMLFFEFLEKKQSIRSV